MNFAFTEEQEELRNIVRQFMEDKSPETAVREQMETDGGYDAAEHGKYFEAFDWKEFTDEEFLLCPPIFAVGGDGAMLDIGFQIPMIYFQVATLVVLQRWVGRRWLAAAITVVLWTAMGGETQPIRLLRDLRDQLAVDDPAGLVDDDHDILVVTDLGFGKRTAVSEFRIQARGGVGVILVKLTDKNGTVTGIRHVHDDDHILVVTERGIAVNPRRQDLLDAVLVEPGDVPPLVDVDCIDVASADVVAEMHDEMLEEAQECVDAKSELSAAQTDDAVDRALRLRREAPEWPAESTNDLPEEPYVLVTTGGGGDGTALVDWVLRAYEADPALRQHALIVYGPFMRAADRAAFDAVLAETIDALGPKFRGPGVAQAVGVDPLVDPRLVSETVEQCADIGRMQRPTFQGAEQLGASGEAQGPALLYPAEDDCH